MKKRNLNVKILSFCLALLFILHLTSEEISYVNSRGKAIENVSLNTISKESINSEGNIFSEKLVIQEDVSRRDEFVKHFYCTDGTFVAIYYPEAVHYEKDGVWYDVNNTLSFDSKTERYKTENTDFVASFASSNIGNLNNYSPSPEKIIEFEKIYVIFDTEGVNIPLGGDHLHGKIPHREKTFISIREILSE